jgi:hypothetical protein
MPENERRAALPHFHQLAGAPLPRGATRRRIWPSGRAGFLGFLGFLGFVGFLGFFGLAGPPGLLHFLGFP